MSSTLLRHVSVQSTGYESACNSHYLWGEARSLGRCFGQLAKTRHLGHAKRSQGVVKPTTLLVGDENAPVFADLPDRNRLTKFESR
jgi:hypothetical protein